MSYGCSSAQPCRSQNSFRRRISCWKVSIGARGILAAAPPCREKEEEQSAQRERRPVCERHVGRNAQAAARLDLERVPFAGRLEQGLGLGLIEGRRHGVYAGVAAQLEGDLLEVGVGYAVQDLAAGVGAAGGVIDSALRKATFSDSYRVVSRLSEYSSHREEVHLNKVVIPKVLAVRLDLMNDEKGYRQKPAYEKDQRIYAAQRRN